jgi:hypothetical protein
MSSLDFLLVVEKAWLDLVELSDLLSLLFLAIELVVPLFIALLAECKATTEVVENTFSLGYPLGAPSTESVLVVV